MFFSGVNIMLQFRRQRWVYIVMVLTMGILLAAQTTSPVDLSRREARIVTRALRSTDMCEEQIAQTLANLTEEQKVAIQEELAGKGWLTATFGASLGSFMGYFLGFLGIVALDLWWENKSLDDI